MKFGFWMRTQGHIPFHAPSTQIISNFPKTKIFHSSIYVPSVSANFFIFHFSFDFVCTMCISNVNICLLISIFHQMLLATIQFDILLLSECRALHVESESLFQGRWRILWPSHRFSQIQSPYFLFLFRALRWFLFRSNCKKSEKKLFGF